MVLILVSTPNREVMFVTKYSINDEDIIVTLMGQEQTLSRNVTFFTKFVNYVFFS